ncbi:MAG: hypothetical protein ACRDXX_05205, partial [Stackebrandtia sp.]
AGVAEGILEDYAAVSSAFVAMFRHGGDEAWLRRAKELVDTILEHFVDEVGALHDTADDAEELVSRPSDPTDGPVASGWALAAAAMLDYLDVAGVDADEAIKDTAWRALAAAAPVIRDHPRFSGGLAGAAQRMAV